MSEDDPSNIRSASPAAAEPFKVRPLYIVVAIAGLLAMPFAVSKWTPANSAQPAPPPLAQDAGADEPRMAITRNAPVTIADLVMQWKWNGKRHQERAFTVSGTLENSLGEPLEYTCISRLTLHIKGKAEPHYESSYNSCGGGGKLGVGKTKKFADSPNASPSLSEDLRTYDIVSIEWELEVRADTPLGASHKWTAFYLNKLAPWDADDTFTIGDSASAGK